jgi:UDP-N-acetylmuramate dehydrogenase
VEDKCKRLDLGNSEPIDPGLIPQVSALVSGRVREFVPAASLTTFAIGGALRALVSVESEAELQSVRALLGREGQPTEVLGFGSNLLVLDGGVSKWVLKLGGDLRVVEHLGNGRYRLGGAASLMALARRISGEGFSGLEFAAGIPASIGGAVFMNAGAHGAELGSRIVSIRGVLPNGEFHEWHRDELPWSYRRSGLPYGAVVSAVEIQLVSGDRDVITKTLSDNLAHRKRTQPLSLPSAGSVFKNPSLELPAGRVLEIAGLKGAKSGGAQVSELHANWIVNPEKRASAADVLDLIRECTERAASHSGIRLEPEVRIWGEL